MATPTVEQFRDWLVARRNNALVYAVTEVQQFFERHELEDCMERFGSAIYCQAAISFLEEFLNENAA